MRKRFVSGMLAMTIAASMLAGCGSSKSGARVSDGGKVLNIACWNDEFQTRMIKHYPGYEVVDGTTGKVGDVTIKWKITPSDNNAYQNALDQSLLAQKDAKADEKIDLFLVEADYALKYVNNDYTLDINNDIGVSADKLKNMYEYTKDITTSKDGKLKGISWQACPGAMIYRRDIAKQVFGTDDPAEIQKKFKDWDTFKQSAAELKNKGYLTNASTTDTYRVFSNNVQSKWVENNKIKIDDNIMNWVKMSKEMVDNGYAGTVDLWSPDWQKGFTKAANVFSYFGPAWLVDFTLGGKDLDGQWAATEGPQRFYWGGTWLCAATGTDNKELVKDIMEKFTTDKKIMGDIVKQEHDFINDKEAMLKMSDDKSYGNEVLGGQNPLKMYCEGAEQISLKNLTNYDEGCNEELQKALKDYYEGKQSLEAALETFYKQVQIKYPELSH